MIVYVVSLLFSFLALGCTLGNENEEKFVGSKNVKGIEFNLNIYRSIEDIKKDSDLIIIASYSENPIEYQEEGIDSSRYFLQVEKVLKGNIAEGDEIVFSQFGKPDNDEGETKIKKDKNIFFVVPCQIKTVVLK